MDAGAALGRRAQGEVHFQADVVLDAQDPHAAGLGQHELRGGEARGGERPLAQVGVPPGLVAVPRLTRRRHHLEGRRAGPDRDPGNHDQDQQGLDPAPRVPGNELSSLRAPTHDSTPLFSSHFP